MDRDEIYKQDILNAISKIEKYADGVEYEAFLKEEMMQDAISRQLGIIGEAAKGLSNDFKLAYPQIPWKDITGTRDILIHDYTKVKQEIVWTTIIDSLPKLKSALEK